MDNTFRLFSYMDAKTTSTVRYQMNVTVHNKCLITHTDVCKLLNKFERDLFFLDKPLQ
jgi:hypothetical protein